MLLTYTPKKKSKAARRHWKFVRPGMCLSLPRLRIERESTTSGIHDVDIDGRLYGSVDLLSGDVYITIRYHTPYLRAPKR